MHQRHAMNHTKKSLLYFVIFLTTHTIITPTTYWNWQLINTHDVQFPKSFEWGITTRSHEVDGYSKTGTWYAWEHHIKANGEPFVQTRSGNAVAHAQHYVQDIQLMKELGITTHFFSIDWSAIEPEQGYFDEAKLQQYADFCDELIKNNITPVISFKDLCDPLWFGYLGGFENEKNIDLFERYCLKVYSTLKDKVYRWITFTAPESYALLGYLIGTTPPGVRNMHSAARVLKNEFEAHVRVYKAIKNEQNGNMMQIGIVKHMHILEPWYFWDRAACYAANMLTNDMFYTFFTSGTFSLRLPLPGNAGAWVKHTNGFAPKSLDFIGINYYSHGYMKNFINHISNPSEIPTDIPGMTVYPEGLYFAIEDVSNNLASKLSIPIIITQNGVATSDESIRDLYLKRHIYCVSKAIKDGHNVQGYSYYSLLDGFSWGSYDKKLGLFAVDRDTLERTKKSGASYYYDVIKKHKR